MPARQQTGNHNLSRVASEHRPLYVLNQPFPTFALIGPRTLAETRTSFAALDIELTPAELRWLNLED